MFFPCFLLSCKANARVKLPKTGHGPHSSKLVVNCVVLSFLCCSVVIVLYCYLCCSAYCLCVLYHCHRVLTQLQLTIHHIISQNMTYLCSSKISESLPPIERCPPEATFTSATVGSRTKSHYWNTSTGMCHAELHFNEYSCVKKKFHKFQRRLTCYRTATTMETCHRWKRLFINRQTVERQLKTPWNDKKVYYKMNH